jgi:DNA-directed RNA polymerase specialized sigma24 family protein
LGLLTQSKQIAQSLRRRYQGREGDVYDEALQRLYVHICERIETFNPQRATVLQWALFLFNHRFINEAKRDLAPLTAPIAKGVTARRLSLEDLEQYSPPAANPLPSTELRHYIEADPEGILCSIHIQNYPEATFQRLAIQRLSGYSWEEISQQFAIPVPTLSSFYQRQLKKFTPKFHAYLSL